MTTLFEKIHDLRKYPQNYQGKIIRGNFDPDPVSILTLSNQNDSFTIIYKSLKDPNRIVQKMFYADQLKDVELIEKDFGGNTNLFFLAMMGHIIRNNYQSDPFFAVGIANIDPLPFQLDAVYNYILPRGRLRFLIADDPGAGKTIMAGLVVKEYLYRGLAKRIMIVCPGSLTQQWEDEMRDKFGEYFQQIDRPFFNSYKRGSIWKECDKIITSIDFIKQKDILESLENVTWDLLICDEAHKFAGIVNKDVFQPNDRYSLGKVICAQALNVVFLTATPHKGDNQVYRMMLALLEPEIFGDEYIYYAPDVNEQVIELEKAGLPIFIRRLKETMCNINGEKIFKRRRSETITWTISEMETQLYRAVSKYVLENFNKALKDRKTSVAFALKIMQRRLLSSSHAIYKTLTNRAKRLQEILENQDFNTSLDELNKMERDYHSKLEAEWDDLSESERNKIEQKLIQLSMAKNPEELKEEILLLQSLAEMALELTENPDQETKLWELKKLMERHLRDPEEKIIIFTEFTDTLGFLEDWINQWGYSVTKIHGSMDKEERKRAREEFQNTKQVMVATEAAGEGINLQFCHLLINYDIPWVPTRLEQRLGRIHRYGQQQDCIFMNLVSDTAADGKPIVEGDVLATLLKKIETIRDALGTDRVYDVIGSNIFDDLSLDQVFSTIKNDPNGYFEIKQKIESDELKKAIESTLEKARSNMTVNLEQIKEISRLSEDMRLWPEYIHNYVQIAMAQYGGKITSTNVIFVPKILQESFSSLESKYENITFKKPETKIYGEVTSSYISLGHPLLEAIIDQSQENALLDLHRGSIFIDCSGFGTGLLWFVEQSVADGNNRSVGVNIGLAFQALDEDLKPQQPISMPVLKLWDFECIQEPLEIELDLDVQRQEAIVSEFFQNGPGKRYYEKIKTDYDRFHQIQVQATKKAHDHQRGYLVQVISDLRNQLKRSNIDEKKREAFEKKKARAENQRDALQSKYDKFQSEMNLRNTLNMSPARILGVALVIPGEMHGKYDRQFLLDKVQREKKIREFVDKQKVDDAAMGLVQSYEEQQGRKVIVVKQINCGYDIESRDPGNSEDIRRIEVKGHTTTGDTPISNNEFKMGLRHGDSFWLYVVENVFDEPILRQIQNPALALFENVEAIQRKTYFIPQETIEEKSIPIQL
ncbi:MAG TPA: helicase-related protein [Candidatus Lokiarchaeia archaeon]|nr:helicase-related protein [Candidatus Lokiarchaeia archaeon]